MHVYVQYIYISYDISYDLQFFILCHKRQSHNRWHMIHSISNSLNSLFPPPPNTETRGVDLHIECFVDKSIATETMQS